MKLGNFRQQHKTGAMFYHFCRDFSESFKGGRVWMGHISEHHFRDVQALMFTDRVAFK